MATSVMQQIYATLEQRYGDQLDRFLLPPPSFETMGGEFLSFDLTRGILQTRFPVLHEWLNPYGLMQGGMIAAAIDNTLGPLSMLVAPPNVTRRLALKFSQGVEAGTNELLVEANFIKREDRWLYFQARAHSPAGVRYASAEAIHWILEPGLN